MARIELNREILRAAVLGGSFFGGGGGGSAEEGRLLGELALSFGTPYLVEVEDVPKEALLVTVSAVGAPAAGSGARAYQYVRAVELLTRAEGLRISGFIANECGGLATVNGWIQSAVFGLPVVDAPCNGRAHPTGVMGSMGLHAIPGYVSLQAAVGGDPAQGTYLEILARGSIEKASAMVRHAAVQAGGLVAVARNPIDAEYVRKHGAPGAVSRCIEVGRAMLAREGKPGLEVVEAAAEASGGEVVACGKVVHKELSTEGGFDVGRIIIEGGYELTFWNEYVTLERDGERLATFPDLIASLDVENGRPLSTAEVSVPTCVAVVVVPRNRLILGAGMRDPSLYRSVEAATGKELIRYVFH